MINAIFQVTMNDQNVVFSLVPNTGNKTYSLVASESLAQALQGKGLVNVLTNERRHSFRDRDVPKIAPGITGFYEEIQDNVMSLESIALHYCKNVNRLIELKEQLNERRFNATRMVRGDTGANLESAEKFLDSLVGEK